MRVLLILQNQLEDQFRKAKVKRVLIQRLDEKQWIPLFEISGESGSTLCSLRVQAYEQVRTWANLTLLAEWLREKFAVEQCDLLLSDDPSLMERFPQ